VLIFACQGRGRGGGGGGGGGGVTADKDGQRMHETNCARAE